VEFSAVLAEDVTSDRDAKGRILRPLILQLSQLLGINQAQMIMNNDMSQFNRR
jgi:hypothetical protein